jgi:hypothetical protein
MACGATHRPLFPITLPFGHESCRRLERRFRVREAPAATGQAPPSPLGCCPLWMRFRREDRPRHLERALEVLVLFPKNDFSARREIPGSWFFRRNELGRGPPDCFRTEICSPCPPCRVPPHTHMRGVDTRRILSPNELTLSASTGAGRPEVASRTRLEAVSGAHPICCAMVFVGPHGWSGVDFARRFPPRTTLDLFTPRRFVCLTT